MGNKAGMGCTSEFRKNETTIPNIYQPLDLTSKYRFCTGNYNGSEGAKTYGNNIGNSISGGGFTWDKINEACRNAQ